MALHGFDFQKSENVSDFDDDDDDDDDVGNS
jgi:hypothetical protein